MNTTKKTTRMVAGIATAALALAMGGFALSQASAAPPTDRPFGQASAVQLGTGELSDAEHDTLLLMADEERMARDLYIALGEKYPDANQFENIAASEQRHYDATLRLLEAYDLDKPSETPGEYQNEEVQDLYDGWLAEGSRSVEAAYQVGVELETLDIADLKEAIEESDNDDLDQVYGHLLTGSEHHLAAFEAGSDWVPGAAQAGDRGQGKGQRMGERQGGQPGKGQQGQGQQGQGRMGGQADGQGGQLRDGSCQD